MNYYTFSIMFTLMEQDHHMIYQFTVPGAYSLNDSLRLSIYYDLLSE